MEPVCIWLRYCAAGRKQPISDIYVTNFCFKILQKTRLSSESFILKALSSEFTMDHRRYFGFRAPRPIGDSTILVPQLENYSLFSQPFLDLQKKIGKSEEVVPKRTTRSEQKTKEEVQQLPSQADDSFGIVLNFATVKPEELDISFGKRKEIEVKVNQQTVESEYGSIPFSRKCTYKYELPDDVTKETLVAVWTSDDYFIILPKDQVRVDLLKESLRGPEESEDFVPPVDESKDADTKGTSKVKDKPKKPIKSKNVGEEKSKKGSDQAKDELVIEELKKMDVKSVIPVYPVTRMLRPGMDIFMLRKYMVDLESYISTARKLVENASFLMHNSKSAERCLRFLAKTHTAEFYEEPNFKSIKKRKMKRKQPNTVATPIVKPGTSQSEESSKSTEQAVSEGK